MGREGSIHAPSPVATTRAQGRHGRQKIKAISRNGTISTTHMFMDLLDVEHGADHVRGPRWNRFVCQLGDEKKTRTQHHTSRDRMCRVKSFSSLFLVLRIFSVGYRVTTETLEIPTFLFSSRVARKCRIFAAKLPVCLFGVTYGNGN